MNIDSLNRNNSLYGNDGLSKKKLKDAYKEENNEVRNKEVSDKLEISLEALKLQPIRNKIAEGFYENPEVLKEVSKKLLDEISTQE